MSAPADHLPLRMYLVRQGWWLGEEPEPDTAWYIRVLLAVAAWLAACLLLPLFALIFSDLLGEPESGLGLAIGGCAVGCALMRAGRGGVFLGQLGAAVALAGQAVAVGTLWDSAHGWWLVAGLALATYVAGLVIVNRLMCGLVFFGALLMLLLPEPLSWWSMPNLAAGTAVLAWASALLWRSEAWLRPAWATWLEPAAWAGSLIAAAAVWLFDGMAADMAPAEFAALSRMRLYAGGACALLPLVAWVAVTFTPEGRYVALPGPRARVLVGLLLLLLIPVFVTAPGIAIGLVFMILGMAHSRVRLVAFGMAVVLGYIARYYYLLHLPLLEKSAWLAVAGSVVLVAGMVLTRVRWTGARNDGAARGTVMQSGGRQP